MGSYKIATAHYKDKDYTIAVPAELAWPRYVTEEARRLGITGICVVRFFDKGPNGEITKHSVEVLYV